MEISKEIIKDLDENERDKLFGFLKEQYHKFINTQELNIPSYEDSYHTYEYFPDLQVVMVCHEIFEGYYNDSMVKCNPDLHKATTVEEAWDKIKDIIAQNYIWEDLE